MKWSQEDYYHDLHSPYNMQLAAGNTAGHVMIWDIRQGNLLNDLVETSRTPLSMEWLRKHQVSHDLLLVLYSSNILILWNADTGVRLWKKVFQDNVISISVDPFNGSNMAGLFINYVISTQCHCYIMIEHSLKYKV